MALKACAGLLAALVGLGICEVVARGLYPAPPDPAREPALRYVVDSEVGYTLLASQAGWIDDGFATINSLGCRGPEIDVPKPAGQTRLLAIGDSITLGWGVNDDETFPAQLERMLRASIPAGRVLNCGVSGYHTGQEAGLLDRIAARLQPDLVLIGLYWNDLQLPSSSPSPHAALAPLSGERSGTFRAGVPPSLLNRTLRRSRAIYCVKNGLVRLATLAGWGGAHADWHSALLEGRDSPAIAEAWRRLERSLRRIAAIAAQQRSTVGIVVLPSRAQVTGDYPKARYQTEVREVAGSLGFFTVDPLPLFRASRAPIDELFIPYDNDHPGPRGHGLIAEAIGSYLRQHPELLRPVGQGIAVRTSSAGRLTPGTVSEGGEGVQ